MQIRDTLDYETATAPAYDKLDAASAAMRAAQDVGDKAAWDIAHAQYRAAQDWLYAIEKENGFRE